MEQLLPRHPKPFPATEHQSLITPIRDPIPIYQLLHRTLSANVEFTMRGGKAAPYGVDSIELQLDHGIAAFTGWGGQTRRMWLTCEINRTTAWMSISLRTTTRQLDVLDITWEEVQKETRADIGNRLLRAWLLHISITLLPQLGVRCIFNQPLDESTNTKLMRIGFQNSRYLDFQHEASMRAAAEYVRVAFAGFAINPGDLTI